MSAQHDIPARIAGLLVFLFGVALLVFVFIAANSLFNAPAPVVPPPPPPGATATGPSAAAEIGKSFSQLFRQILLLLLMCVAGSVIASKGIQLYFAARPASAPGATPNTTPAGSAARQPATAPPSEQKPAPDATTGTGSS